MGDLLAALSLQMGYNATLVAIGAALLGAAAGVTGTFLFLRKRALVSDAISHATLPGVGIAFMVMVALGGDGRSLVGLMIGSALSAVLGLLCVGWLTQRTRLSEDASIGAVLSVFFGFGVVLLTVIQTMSAGRQAGLESFLLGATAGMLRSEALVIAGGGTVAVLLVALLRRPMTLAAFDPEYTAGAGWPLARIDFAMMALVTAVTVVGLKIVGLILIVALLIIPPVAARFWSARAGHVAALAGVIGALSGFIGAAISASAPSLPTGPIIVLVSSAIFVLSLLVAPERGVLASMRRRQKFHRAVHLRQGLLALAHAQPVYEPLTQRLLRKEGLLRADGVPTPAGEAAAAAIRLDERRWQVLRADPALESAAAQYDGLTDVSAVLTRDQMAQIDARLGTDPWEATA